MRSLDDHRDHGFDAGVAFVEDMGEELGIAVDAERELRQVVRADREAVEDLAELGRQDHVARDLAHDVDLEALIPTLEAVARHLGQDLPPFLGRPTERHHHLEVAETHVVAHPAQGLALEGEAFAVALVMIARRAAKADHRVGLAWLEGATAEEIRILVGLEVREADDHRTGMKGGRDGPDARSHAIDEELARRAPPGDAVQDLVALLGVLDALGMDQRHGMDAAQTLVHNTVLCDHAYPSFACLL